MRDDKETLEELGAQLSQTLKNLTANYRLGFGSFADKPIFPMILPQHKENPCAAERTKCEPTYGYRHQLSRNCRRSFGKHLEFFIRFSAINTKNAKLRAALQRENRPQHNPAI